MTAIPVVRGSTGRGRPLRHLAAVLALVAGCVALLIIGARPAWAHAALVSSDPSDGAQLAHAPAAVTITFDQPVGLDDVGYLHVTDAHGTRVDTGSAYHPNGNEAVIAAKLRAGLGDGSYIESYRVISADSHPVAGVVRFVVGTGSLAPATSGTTSAVNPATGATFDVARWISYAGLMLFGGVWLLVTVWPDGLADRRATGIVWAGWAALTVGAMAELYLQGPYAAGIGPAGVTHGALLVDTVHGVYGHEHLVRLVALLALAVVWAVLTLGRPAVTVRHRARWAPAVLPLAVAMAVTFSLTGHPETTNPRWLSVTVDLLHLCAAGAWIGSLVMTVCVILPRRRADVIRRSLPAVSRVSFTAVVVLVASGAYAAVRGVGSVDAIVTTEYGLLVTAKVLLLVGLVMLGNVSRRVIARRLTRPAALATVGVSGAGMPGDESRSEAPGGSDGPVLGAGQMRRIRRGIIAEIALAAVVLAATAVLVNQPRGPEALAARHLKPVTAIASLGDGHHATVTADPGTHGTVSLTIALSDGTSATAVTATATQKARQLGPIPLPLTRAATRHYTAADVNLPVSGTWTIDIVVTESEFDAVTAEAAIDLY